MMTEKNQISEELRDLIDAHLEGVGFLTAALDKCMQGEITEEQKNRFRNEIEVMESRNIQIRKEVG
jgi:hypothetical protein